MCHSRERVFSRAVASGAREKRDYAGWALRRIRDDFGNRAYRILAPTAKPMPYALLAPSSATGVLGRVWFVRTRSPFRILSPLIPVVNLIAFMAPGTIPAGTHKEGVAKNV
jgi:hypothetical protein